MGLYNNGLHIDAIVTRQFTGRLSRLTTHNYDDQNWIYLNPNVIHRFGWSSLAWAATGVVNGMWCPLTNLSFIIERQCMGIHPAGSHFINLILHLANVSLLFRFLTFVCGLGWRAMFVAIVFAIHPMNVETVAWVIRPERIA